jgi:uncharacterized protein (TIGR03437 family)
MPRSMPVKAICLLGWLPLFLSVPCRAQSYIITTAAGGADVVFFSGTGDGGPATSAGLAKICYDVALDAQDNLYIVSGRLVRKVDKTGTISTYAGGGSSAGEDVPATSAELQPIAIAADTSGNVYIADTAFGLTRVRRIDSNGNINTVAGGAPCCVLGDGGPALNAYLAEPSGLAVDSAGNIYIADQQSNVVRKVNVANGSINTVAGGGNGSGDGVQATSVALASPTGVTLDLAGNLYIAEYSGNRIRQVAPNGVISTVAGNGAASNSGDGQPAVKAGLDAPWHVAVDTSGNLFISQINDATIRLVNPMGTITTLAGTGTHGFSGDNGPATSAMLDRPAGVVVSGNTGAVYIADATSSIARVRQLTPLPYIVQGGVVPVYSSTNTIQPGSWVSIFGSGLATQTARWNGDFPTSLGGTTVTIDSKPAYLWYVSPGQINLQPADDNTIGPVTVVITTSVGTATSTVTLAAYAPSLSMFSSKYPAAVAPTPGSPGNSGNGYDYIGPAGAFPFPTRPARAGETLLLFGVGFGPTNPATPAGQLVTNAAPSVTTPQFTIGGVTAAVNFAGVVEAGLFQFNIVVPQAASGDQSLQGTVNGIPIPSGILLTLQ